MTFVRHTRKLESRKLSFYQCLRRGYEAIRDNYKEYAYDRHRIKKSIIK